MIKIETASILIQQNTTIQNEKEKQSNVIVES